MTNLSKDRGLVGIEGHLLGSMPADGSRHPECDVLVAHRTG